MVPVGNFNPTSSCAAEGQFLDNAILIEYRPRPVASKAAPRQGAAAPVDARGRMQMAGDFALARLRDRLVAEHQRSERQRSGEHAADAIAGIGIMIAGDPDPVATALQPQQ